MARQRVPPLVDEETQLVTHLFQLFTTFDRSGRTLVSKSLITLAKSAVVVSSLLSLPPALANGVRDTLNLIALEEPAAEDSATGISNLRGWAVSPWGVDRVELYIDDIYQFDIPSTGARLDVCRVYKPTDYPGSCFSGFSMAYNYSNLSSGWHTARVRVIDDFGDWNDTSADFEVTRFSRSFIPSADQLSLTYTFPVLLGQTEFAIACLWADGNFYDAFLTWDPAKQDWKTEFIRNVDAYCPPEAGTYEHYWFVP